MFFILGISQGRKRLEYTKTVICGVCSGYGRYQVFMTYTCLSLFFIPVFKWGRRYYVEMSCCNTTYELKEDKGNLIRLGRPVDISEQDLTLREAGWSNFRQGHKLCKGCGYETEEDFLYCPQCGHRF